MAYGVIYVITNKLNDMKYVGQTTRSAERRFKEHAKKNTPLGRAMQESSTENFAIEVIEECETKAQMNEREIFWIARFNCKVPNGYNQTDGGETGCPHKPEACAKIGEANKKRKGKKRSPEQRKSIKLGADNYWAKVRAHKMERHAEYHPRARIWGDIYPTLEAELQKKNITTSKLVEVLGLSDTEVCRKMRGERNFKPAQMEAIRNFLGVEMSVEELFKRAD